MVQVEEDWRFCSEMDRPLLHSHMRNTQGNNSRGTPAALQKLEKDVSWLWQLLQNFFTIRQTDMTPQKHRHESLWFLTQHGGLFEELVASLKSHLLQRRWVGPDGVAVQRLINALEAHVVRHQRQMSGIHLNTWTQKHTQCHTLAPLKPSVCLCMHVP